MSIPDELTDAINYIESQVDYVISKMIDARRKHIDSSQVINDKLASVLSNVYSYRLGKSFEDMVKVEKGTITQKDAYKPSITLNYTGSKMTLNTPEGDIEVPSIPIFVYQRPTANDIFGAMNNAIITQGVLIELPPTANVAEEPNFEDSYGKYFTYDFVDRNKLIADITTPAGKRISFGGYGYEIDKFESKVSMRFEKYLTIDGTNYYFILYARHGNVVAKAYYTTVESLTDIRFDGIYLILRTNYPDVIHNVFGKRFDAGVFIDPDYYKELVIVGIENTLHIVEARG